MGRSLHFLSKITGLLALCIHIHKANEEGVYVHTFKETCVSLNFIISIKPSSFIYLFILIIFTDSKKWRWTQLSRRLLCTCFSSLVCASSATLIEIQLHSRSETQCITHLWKEFTEERNPFHRWVPVQYRNTDARETSALVSLAHKRSRAQGVNSLPSVPRQDHPFFNI